MMPRRPAWLIPAGIMVLWLIGGLLIVPPLLEILYRSEAIPALSSQPLSFYLEEWRAMVYYGVAVGIIVHVFVRRLRNPTTADRLVPDARPTDLGAIRLLVGSVLLISTLWEDLASTAAIPRELMNPLGVMKLVALVPGYESFAASEHALLVFEWITAAVLFAGAIGWRTRVTVPIGAVLYLVHGGLLRQYASFYHTGLAALFLYAVLAFLPCGLGLSIDRLRRLRRGEKVAPDLPTPRIGWARYAVWTTLAVPYVAAGLSKLRNGGLFWWEASNFKFILFQSTLRPMEFDFRLSLNLAAAPDWVFAALALSAVLGELLYGLVLFSRRARWILPITMLFMHVGILLLQNILFFDLILLQLIFLNFRPLLRAVSSRLPAFRPVIARAGILGALTDAPTVTRSNAAWGRRLTVGMTILFAACWLFRVEFYPFTGMQMFSSKRGEPVIYERVLAHTRSGEIVRAPIEESIGAMSDGRYRRLLPRAFDPDRSGPIRAFMQSVADRWNARAAESEQIERIEIQLWEWYYLSEPADSDFGSLIDRVEYPVGPDDF